MMAYKIEFRDRDVDTILGLLNERAEFMYVMDVGRKEKHGDRIELTIGADDLEKLMLDLKRLCDLYDNKHAGLIYESLCEVTECRFRVAWRTGNGEMRYDDELFDSEKDAWTKVSLHGWHGVEVVPVLMGEIQDE